MVVPGEVLYSQGRVAHHKQDMVSMNDTAYSDQWANLAGQKVFIFCSNPLKCIVCPSCTASDLKIYLSVHNIPNQFSLVWIS